MKPVFRVFNQLEPTCAATEANSRLEILDIETKSIILSSEQQRCWSDCANAQADLHLCCSHMAKTGFLMTRLILRKSTKKMYMLSSIINM